MVELTKIAPNPRNPNRHPKAQVELLAKVIKATGWRSPIIVSNRSGLVVKGHCRLEAARILGEAQAPVDYQDYATAEAETADLLADNRIAELSDPDEAQIAALLNELTKTGIDPETAGFSTSALDRLMAKIGLAVSSVNAEPKFDQAKQLSEKWKTKTGQVWQLGEHRLMIGDCTNAKHVAQLFSNQCPVLMVTDPPYGVKYDPEWRNRAGLSNTKRTGKVQNDHQADWREAWSLFPGNVAYIWHAGVHASTVQASIEASGFTVRCQVIWAKSRLVLSRGDYHWQHEPCFYITRQGTTDYLWQHEPCLYIVRKGKKGQWTGDRSQTTLWNIGHKDGEEETVHGTQKPVECMARPIRNNTRRGDIVYDPFVGSGTTIIAAERNARRAMAMEISPEYAAVTIQRWLDATGIQPTLAP